MARAIAGALAVNRVLFGIGYVVAPRRTGERWIGKTARRPGADVVTRALGARDLVLGAGALAALARSQRREARGWFAAHAVADATDLLATLLARDELPRSGFRFATAMAAGSTAIAALGAARA
jgi:hypothetical protein